MIINFSELQLAYLINNSAKQTVILEWGRSGRRLQSWTAKTTIVDPESNTHHTV